MLSDYIFQKALVTIADIEGGYSNDKDDPGGETNYGISLRFLKGVDLDDGDVDFDGDIDADDIRKMTPEKSKLLFYEYFWKNTGCYAIAAYSAPVAIKLLDMSINMGPRQAAKCLQTALNKIGSYDLVVDGKIGPKSITALESLAKNFTPHVLQATRDASADFYRALVAKKPSLGKFLKGWLRRAYLL